MLGLSAIVGTGIFILIAGAVQRSGPATILAFAIAGLVCAAAALCYAELGSMIPVAGGSYSYAYVSLGEVAAWLVGWALLAEYMVGASAISVGWASYVTYLVETAHEAVPWIPPIDLPDWASSGYFAGGAVNVVALAIIALVTGLLAVGTRAGIRFAMLLLALKIAALLAFIAFAAPSIRLENFTTFAPLGMAGIGAASASIFFAYLGFDGVASAAEEVHRPRRNVPIGILGAVAIATILNLAVAATAIGAGGGQPVPGADGDILSPATRQFALRCAELAAWGSEPLACSNQAIAHVLNLLGHPRAASIIAIVVFVALPSAVVATLYAQSRLMFALARDGLLPQRLAKVSPRRGTPLRMIVGSGAITGALAALVPIGQLADIANGGTLYAFFMTAVGLLVLRRRRPDRVRPFRLPAAWLIAPLAAAGCALLFFRLSSSTLAAFGIWMAGGLVFYLAYGFRRSLLAASGAARS